jgi:uncharacterized protein YndB with AHSA1/START domain
MTSTSDPVTDTERELRELDNGLNALVIRRVYHATRDELWDAITDPDRLVRWFLPVSGDLREGGRFSLEGNASGEIVRCDKPNEIALTWEMGGGTSNVWLRLSPVDTGTLLELEHSPVPAEIIPNASMETWGLGAGWEMGLTALGDYLAGKLPEGKAKDWIANATPEQMMEAAQLSTRISDAWAAVIAARG